MTTLEQATWTLELRLHIRPAVKSDLPKLEWYGQYTHFRHLFRRAFREQQAGRRLMLIADCNRFPVGHVFIQFNSTDKRIADGLNRAYLYSLRVMEIFRQQGIGTRLLREADDLLSQQGFHWVSIAVAKDNERARRLYERLGYQVFREDPGEWHYLDHEGRTRFVHEPCWMLEKPLSIR